MTAETKHTFAPVRPTLNSTPALRLLALVFLHGEADRAFPAWELISETGLSAAKIKHLLRALVKLGWLTVERYGKHVLYKVTPHQQSYLSMWWDFRHLDRGVVSPLSYIPSIAEIEPVLDFGAAPGCRIEPTRSVLSTIKSVIPNLPQEMCDAFRANLDAAIDGVQQ